MNQETYEVWEHSTHTGDYTICLGYFNTYQEALEIAKTSPDAIIISPQHTHKYTLLSLNQTPVLATKLSPTHYSIHSLSTIYSKEKNMNTIQKTYLGTIHTKYIHNNTIDPSKLNQP